MLKRTKDSVICSSILFLFAVSAQADSASSTRNSVRAAYKTSQAAFARRDVKTLAAQLAPNYYLINIKGQKLNRSETIRMMKLWFSTSKTLNANTSIKRLQVVNGKVTAVVAEHATASGVNPKTKKLMKLVSDSLAEETWIKTNGRWLKQRTKTLRMRWLVDGKPQKL
ncbi:protein of unknown function (DUF4440) [Abditibacterium utsteinense]|uniref:DUF4440 domain-containing protein n=1 Tax=Abditibacterium utsteinense TaxID=1960156 RepID=A0A2S8SV32_9BACT|nr:nuclear transport factor 2 family protein [Abditibacterium utsteinense]PQV64651.1 protein of unknown function (DUF4440) [Abditibacterium utsteinense]